MPVLAYWDIRGLAQPIRLLLKYVGENFEDKRYEVGPSPDYSRDSWINVKPTLGLDFPNLPYYIDGEVKTSQSNAILRYIGRKHNLCGTTEAERVRVDLMENQSMDFRNGFTPMCYNPQFEALKEKYMKILPSRLEAFEKFIGDGSFFAGENVTMIDFPMYELLDQHRLMEPACLDAYPKLKAFLDRFEALPAIKSYMESNEFMKWPVNNDMAKWGAREAKSSE